MWRNTQDRWGVPARVLHWGMALLIAAQVPLGFWMNRIYKQLIADNSQDFSQLLQVSQWHHTVGFCVLLLVVARLVWRAVNPAPGLPIKLAPWQRYLARTTHIVLYGLLITFPLTGWATLSAYEGEFPIYFFGWDGSHAPYEFYAAIHKACWRLGAAVLALHVAAALWHQLVAKDNLLRRMWRP
jgi:cytochrome b561